MSVKNRLDHELFERGLVASRSQAESYIKLGKVKVDGKTITKSGYFVRSDSKVELLQAEQFVSRAALKLAGASDFFNINFKNKIVLDVGSSTGGFSDYALKRGAKKIYAVEVGTNQLHPILQNNPKIELHEQTDIRSFRPLSTPDIILIDVSFISLRQILPHIKDISSKNSLIVAMLKPQFETDGASKHKGVIKNDSFRRQIIKSFELWVKTQFVIHKKTDSQVAGEKGNVERFYLLSPL